jgi:hypothetical protein
MKVNFGFSVCAAAAALAFACAQPAHAGSWVLTSSVNYSVAPGTWGSGLYTNYNTSTSYSFGDAFDNGSSGEWGTFTYTGKIQWTGGGTQPSSVTLTESGGATADALYATSATQTANDGLGDPSHTAFYSSPRPYVETTSSGNHTTNVSIAPGGTYTFSRTLSASSYSPTLNDCNVSYSISIQ